MHELSVCQALIDQVQQIAQERQATTVDVIHLRIGPLSGVEADLLQNAFPIASAGTLAEKAELVINAQPLRVKCNSCGHVTEASPNNLACEQCGDWRTTLESGDEMLLESVELTAPEH
jgi:hydrogenase nickel incorporation protein HypA/HybF